MGIKAVLEESRNLTATIIVQDANQAVDLGNQREVAVIATCSDITTAGIDIVIQTAIEPFDSCFVDVPSNQTLNFSTTSAVPTTKMVYVTQFARYLRWRRPASPAGTCASMRIELYAKEPA